MPKGMGYDNGSDKSMSRGGKDSSAKSSGGSVESGLSSRSGMGDYAKGDPIGDNMPNGGADPTYKVKKAGKSFEVC